MQLSLSSLLAFALVQLDPLPPGTSQVPHVPRATPASQEEEVQDEREDVEEALEALEGHVKQRGEEDEQAIARIDELLQLYPELGPKDRDDVVDGLESCFKAKRTRELEEGVPDDRLYYAAATALGEMGPESVKPLIGLLGHKSHRSNLRLQARIARSIGNTKDERGVKPLLELLKDKDKEMQAAGAEALGSYEGAELDTRKEIVEDLIRAMMGQKTKKDGDPTDVEAHERWNAISGPILASLQRLAHMDETSPEEWQRWWNKNKKKDWDEE